MLTLYSERCRQEVWLVEDQPREVPEPGTMSSKTFGKEHLTERKDSVQLTSSLRVLAL
jgi:hypothetical protein